MKTINQRYLNPMQPVVSTRPSSVWTRRNLHDGDTCTTAVVHPSVLILDWETLPWLASTQSKPLNLDVCPTPFSSSIDFVAQLTNRSPLSFEIQTKKPSCWFWDTNHQTVGVGLRLKLENPPTPVLRLNREKPSQWCWGQTTDKPSTLVLRLKQVTCAPALLVHGTDRIQRHPTSRSSDHRVPDMCLIIPGPPHQVSYSCHNSHRCPPCHTCHLHTTR
jgi:hypothetical protein